MEILKAIKAYSLTNKIAIRHREDILTYSELEKYSEALAYYLLTKCKGDKKPIVIYGNKENNIIPCMFGAIKSGRPYIPIDVTFPLERVKEIVEEVNCDIVIDFSGLDLENNLNLNVIRPKELENIFSAYKDKSVEEESWIKEEDICYILFTSGSTGKPKGVQITRKNIESFTGWFSSYCDINSEEGCVLNQVSYSFDVSVIPIYISLSQGKTLFSLDKEMLEDYKLLFKNLSISDIYLWTSTPTFAEICLTDAKFNKNLLPNIKRFIFIGEVLTKKLVNNLKERFDEVSIVNGYGPTETTVVATAIEVKDEMLQDDKEIPIGYQLEDGMVRITDEFGKEVLKGEKGELILSGNSVAKGYFNNRELTEKVFFESFKGIRSYKTGDLVYESNGLIYYCGRKDFQIKLNGFRIELGDIENNLNKVSYIQNAIVLPVYKENKISYICGIITLNKKYDISNLKLSILIKQELKELIPSYMIPKKIIIKDEFPVNSNGKIDRKALMEAM